MENENVSKNFIEQMIDKDIEEGHCKVVHTRFPPEPKPLSPVFRQSRMAICISVMRSPFF